MTVLTNDATEMGLRVDKSVLTKRMSKFINIDEKQYTVYKRIC